MPAAHCSGMQTFAILVNTTSLILLLYVYFTAAYSSDAFISTELRDHASIRVLLSMFVVTNTLVCLAYIYVRTGPAANRFYAASAGALVSVVGWMTLVSTDMESVGHITGTAMFVAGMGAYVLIMFLLRDRIEYIYLLGYAAVAVLTIVFIVLDCTSQQNTDRKATAAFTEWGATACNTCTLLLFFITHPFEQKRTPTVEQMPLLVHMQDVAWV